MPRIRASLSKITLDRGNFTKKLNEEIQRQFKLAARAFFLAAIPNIPVQTGFARGSMNNLANAVGASETSGTNSRAKKYLSLMRKLKRVKFGDQYYRFGGRRVLKTPESGRMFSTKPENILKYENGRYVFNFNVTISYFNLNDLSVHNPNSPWNAFSMGRVAFENYMSSTGLRNLPKITNYLVKSKVTVG